VDNGDMPLYSTGLSDAGWIDISVPLRNGMVHWPGDPPFHIERFQDQGKGDEATVSNMSLSAHTGTHMDAPLHYIRDAPGIDTMPLDATIGVARVIRIHNAESIQRDELARHAIQRGERILFRTRNSEHAWDSARFEEDFVSISPEGAHYLAECGVRTIGVDYLSVGSYRKDGAETHEVLLSAGIWVIEGLDLRNVEPGEYDLVCLPLKLVNADGAPARAALRKRF
jgi:arylformamidase